MSEAAEMNHYDPNLQWAVHVVELTYLVWDYKATATVQIRGNTKGFSILGSALNQHADMLFEAQGSVPVLVLTKPGEEDNTLECTCDEYVRENDSLPDIELWLELMCVGIRILSQLPEERAKL